MKARKRILVTAPLDDVHTDKMDIYHDVDVIPFIRIDPVVSEELKNRLDQLRGREQYIVFTSNNGVKSVANLIGEKPEKWKMFCINGVTSKSVEQYFGADSLSATGMSGEALADEILKNDKVQEVIFFCGDLRRDELPERLRSMGIKVAEIIVYHTTATPLKVEKEYDAILFFSPSSVYSYIAMNHIPAKTVCFSIGNTTANTIKNLVNNTVLIAQPPQKARVVEMVLEYFN